LVGQRQKQIPSSALTSFAVEELLNRRTAGHPLYAFNSRMAGQGGVKQEPFLFLFPVSVSCFLFLFPVFLFSCFPVSRFPIPGSRFPVPDKR
jgi:hypothetical protein